MRGPNHPKRGDDLRPEFRIGRLRQDSVTVPREERVSVTVVLLSSVMYLSSPLSAKFIRSLYVCSVVNIVCLNLSQVLDWATSVFTATADKKSLLEVRTHVCGTMDCFCGYSFMYHLSYLVPRSNSKTKRELDWVHLWNTMLL